MALADMRVLQARGILRLRRMIHFVNHPAPLRMTGKFCYESFVNTHSSLTRKFATEHITIAMAFATR